MRKSSAGFRRWVWLLLAIVGVIPSWCLAASKPATAKFSVDGVGFLRNRELSAALTRLLDTELKETLDANAIEDAAVILVSSLGEQGFQKPEIVIDTLSNSAEENARLIIGYLVERGFLKYEL